MDVQACKASVPWASLPYPWISSKLELYWVVSATSPLPSWPPSQVFPSWKHFPPFCPPASFLIFWASLSRVRWFVVKAKHCPCQDGHWRPSGVCHRKGRTAALGQEVTCLLLFLLGSCWEKQWDEAVLQRKLLGFYLQLRLLWISLSLVYNFWPKSELKDILMCYSESRVLWCQIHHTFAFSCLSGEGTVT